MQPSVAFETIKSATFASDCPCRIRKQRMPINNSRIKIELLLSGLVHGIKSISFDVQYARNAQLHNPSVQMHVQHLENIRTPFATLRQYHGQLEELFQVP